MASGPPSPTSAHEGPGPPGSSAHRRLPGVTLSGHSRRAALPRKANSPDFDWTAARAVTTPLLAFPSHRAVTQDGAEIAGPIAGSNFCEDTDDLASGSTAVVTARTPPG